MASDNEASTQSIVDLQCRHTGMKMMMQQNSGRSRGRPGGPDPQLRILEIVGGEFTSFLALQILPFFSIRALLSHALSKKHRVLPPSGNKRYRPKQINPRRFSPSCEYNIYYFIQIIFILMKFISLYSYENVIIILL